MEQIIEDWGLQTLNIVEGKQKKEGVLAVLEGDSFFSKIPSRNKRIYPEKAWINVLSESGTKRILEDGLMFGTVGHLNVDMDQLIRDGKVGFRTSKLKYNESTGIGRGTYELLDTSLGRFLYMAAKSGSKFKVSTKAMGEYKGSDSEGNQLVDPDNFKLERIDFVVDPGYLQAQPEMKEQLEEAYHYNDENSRVSEDKVSLDEIITNKSVKEDVDMSKELAEKLMEEKVGLEGELSKVAKELELSEVKVKNYDLLNEQYTNSVDKVKELEVSLSAYDEFFEEVGDMDMIKTTLLQAKTFGESVKEHGSIAEIAEKLEILDAFLALSDTPEDVEEALTRAATLSKALNALVECEEGEDPIEKITEALTKASGFILDKKNEDLKSDIAEVAATHGVEEDAIENLVKVEGKEKASSILEMLKTGKSKKAINDEGNDDKSSVFNQSKKTRASRMMENFGG